MNPSPLAFLGVGVMAALVHYLVAVLGHAVGISPMQANNLGFLCAFPVSYLGHRRWTFQGANISHRQGVGRFFLVALFGFFGNQALVWVGLHWTPAPFWLVLGVSMVLIAVSTYVFSRFWAFAHG